MDFANHLTSARMPVIPSLSSGRSEPTIRQSGYYFRDYQRKGMPQTLEESDLRHRVTWFSAKGPGFESPWGCLRRKARCFAILMT